MFKFGFGSDKSESSKDDPDEKNIEWYVCCRLTVPEDMDDRIKNMPSSHIIEINYGRDLMLKCVAPNEIIKNLKEKPGCGMSDVVAAEVQHSDLVPGKYEGGLKTWECTRDLVQYMSDTDMLKSETFKGKRVLDLGCGSGILGIVALMYGAHVTFQDYNYEVLENLTMSNVFVNVQDAADRVDFYFGDWSSFLEELQFDMRRTDSSESRKFHFILSSETIYNPVNYKKVYKLIKEMLHPDGVALVAAKAIYFGVGGSIRDFQTIVKTDESLNCKTCWSTTNGVSREILEITFKKTTGNT